MADIEEVPQEVRDELEFHPVQKMEEVLRIALTAPDRFGSLLALGLTVCLAVQALVNVSVATAVMPTKGIPLPFISNGGSSLLVSMVAVGVLLNISQHASHAVAAPARQSNWTFNRQEA